jgi:hypothetical protein
VTSRNVRPAATLDNANAPRSSENVCTQPMICTCAPETGFGFDAASTTTPPTANVCVALVDGDVGIAGASRLLLATGGGDRPGKRHGGQDGATTRRPSHTPAWGAGAMPDRAQRPSATIDRASSSCHTRRPTSCAAAVSNICVVASPSMWLPIRP